MIRPRVLLIRLERRITAVNLATDPLTVSTISGFSGSVSTFLAAAAGRSQTGVGGVPIAPDLFEQDVAGEHLPRFTGERHEEIEFEGVSEMGTPSRLTLCAGTSISTGPIDRSSAGSSSVRRSQADAGDEFFRFERLDHASRRRRIPGPGPRRRCRTSR